MKQVFEYVQSIVVIALILAGIGGVAYNMFREAGWIEFALSNVWEFYLLYPMVAIPVTIVAIVLGSAWRTKRLAHGYYKKLPDFFIYVVMAAGIYYISYFFMYGSL